MPVVVVNLTTSPLWVRLTSGDALRLSPGGASAALPDVEVENNPKLDRLREQRLIHVEKEEEEAAAPSGGEAAEPVPEHRAEAPQRSRKRTESPG